MKSHKNWFTGVFICMFSALLVNPVIADDDKNISTRNGKLTIVGESGNIKLIFNGKKLLDNDSALSFSFEKKFVIGDRDIVLVMNNSGGTACPATYFFVSISTQGDVKLSPDFGSCSDLPNVKATNTSITVKTAKTGGRGFETAVYENDILTVDGHPKPMNPSGVFKTEEAQTKSIPGVGVHPSKLVLSKNWKNKFIKITEAKFQDFVDRLEVATDTQIEGDWITGSGLAPHLGGSDEAALAILVTTGQVFGAMLENGDESNIYKFGFSSWKLAPKFLLEWALQRGLKLENDAQLSKNKVSSSNAPPVPNISGNLVPAPTLNIGYSYTFETENKSDNKLNFIATREITNISGNRMTLTTTNVKTGSKRTSYYDTSWGYLGSGNNDKDGVTFSPALKYLDFPLTVGKQWKAQSIETDSKTGRQRQHTIYGTVEGWEKIKVPAGEFDALKISLKTEVKDADKISEGTDTSWYVPSLQRSVKSELTGKDASTGLEEKKVIQLIAHNIPSIKKVSPEPQKAPEKPASIASATPPSLKVGDTFRTKKFDIQIVQYSIKRTLGDGILFESKAPEGGIYIAIRYKYKNITSKPIGSFSTKPEIKLKSPDGTKYEADLGASATYATELNLDEKILSDLNPGITVNSASVFEVSQELFNAATWKILIEADEKTELAFQ